MSLELENEQKLIFKKPHWWLSFVIVSVDYYFTSMELLKQFSKVKVDNAISA